MSNRAQEASPQALTGDTPQFSKTQFQESVFQDSVLAEPSLGSIGQSGASQIGELTAGQQDARVQDDEKLLVPLMGAISIAKILRTLYFSLALFLSCTFTLTYYSFKHSEEIAIRVRTVGESLMQAQRMAKSANEALIGEATAFAELRESALQLGSGIKSLENNASLLSFVGADQAPGDARLHKVSVAVEGSLGAASVILGQQQLLSNVSNSLKNSIVARMICWILFVKSSPKN